MPRADDRHPLRRSVLAGLVAIGVVSALAAAGCTGTDENARSDRARTSTRAGNGTTADLDDDRALVGRLHDALERNVNEYPAVPGEAAAVLLPHHDVQASAGSAAPDGRVPLTPDTPFRIASVTKTFVAVAALRLVEQGRLDLDAPIGPLLDPATSGLLADDGYDLDRITVRRLLNHTAGLFDFAASDAYDDVNTDDPGHRWTRAEQLRFAVDHGDPLAEPGEEYHYDDTGYLLVGEIIERITGQTLPAAVRDLDGFARLGLDATWWETLEPAPAGAPARAHQFAGRHFDNTVLDASADLYGGGGLVSTVGDVARFYRALFDGKVFDHDATLDEMLTVSGPGRDAGAALGIFETRIAGSRCYGHPGWWGTEAYHCPEPDLTFALTVNQADESLIDTRPVERTILGLAR